MSLISRILRKFQKVNYTTANIISLSPAELLKDRIALITGGTSGIGYAIAEAFLKNGAKVIITGRNEEKLNCAVSSLKQIYQENIKGFVMDNSNIKSFDEYIKSVITQWGKLDILVNNAGINSKHNVKDVTEDEYNNIMSTNLKGPYFLSKIVAEYMRDCKINGNILNIASSSSLRPAAAPYALSKWGLRGMTLGLARAFAPYNITVNGLAPGPTATPMMMKDTSHIEHPNLPLGRYIMPEEIANMAVILVSDVSRAIIGDVIYMTGGAGLTTLEGDNYNF